MMDATLQVPLGEQPHLKEMFAMLETNHMDAQAQNMEDILQYFDNMEKYFGEMQEELSYLHEQLDTLNEKTLKAKLNNLAETVGSKVNGVKIWFRAIKNEVSGGIRDAVEYAKYKGVQALDKAIDRMKISKALGIIQEHLTESVKSLESGSQTLDAIGEELHAAKGHKKNARNLLMGKGKIELTERDRNKGVLAKVKQILQFCKKIIKGMSDSTEKTKESLDNFSLKAVKQREEKTNYMSNNQKAVPETVTNRKGR